MFLRVKKQFECKHFSKTASRGAKTCPAPRGCLAKNVAGVPSAKFRPVECPQTLPTLRVPNTFGRGAKCQKLQALFQNASRGAKTGAPCGGAKTWPVSPPNSPNMFLRVKKQFECKHFSKTAPGVVPCPPPWGANLAKKNVAGVPSANFARWSFAPKLSQHVSKGQKTVCQLLAKNVAGVPSAKFRPVDTFPKPRPGVPKPARRPPWSANLAKNVAGGAKCQISPGLVLPLTLPASFSNRATCLVLGALIFFIRHGWKNFLGWVGGTNRSDEGESRWIVAARPLCHLQYRVAYLSRAKDSTRRKGFYPSLDRNCALRRLAGLVCPARLANGTCLWRVETPWSRKRTANDATGARSLLARFDLEAFSHNPTHAHVPYWWVNNPTLGEFCFTMIGRADIEGSKSNVAMNAWLHKLIPVNQTSFYPFVPHEISVLVELILGHLRYLLTRCAAPKPNSPTRQCLPPDRPAEAGLGSKKRGALPRIPIHGIIGLESSSTGSSFPADSAKPVPLAVVSLDSRQGQVIVTPAVYPRLVEFLHFDIQSTGQKSHCVNIRRGPSQCFVLIKSRIPRIPLVRTEFESTFDARGRGPEGPVPESVPPDRTRRPAAPRKQLERSPPTGRRVRDWDPRAQPSEPILFPRLRIHFADFPCLHCSIDQRLFTLETDAVMSTTGVGGGEALGPPDFPGAAGAHRTPRDVRCSSGRWTLPPGEPARSERYQTGFPRPLGSTNPCASAVHMEPPLFGLQSSHLNICYYHQDRDDERSAARPRPVFCATAAPSYSSGPGPCPDGGYRLARAVGHRNPASGSSRIAARLPKMAHLELSIPWHGSTKQPRRPTYLKTLARSSGYPEGNFGGNQLLDVSLRASTEFRLASPRSGIVHHLSGPDAVCSHSNPSRKIGVGRRCNPQGDPAQSASLRLRVYSPVDSHTCPWTPWSVFQDGPNPGSPRCRCRRARSPGLGHRHNPHRSVSRADRRTGSHRSTSDRDTPPAPIRFPPDNFKHSLTLFSKSFSLSLAYLLVRYRSLAVFSLGRNLPPDWGCIPKQPDSRDGASWCDGVRARRGSPLSAPPSGGLGPGPPPRTLLRTTIRRRGDRFSWWAIPAPADRGLVRGVQVKKTHEVKGPNPTQRCTWPASSITHPPFGHRTLGRELSFQPTKRQRGGGRPSCTPRNVSLGGNRRGLCFVGKGAGRARHDRLRPDSGEKGASLNASSRPNGYRQTGSPVQLISRAIDNDPSAGSPTETLLRLLLPLNDKVQWTSHNVTGSEPPTSPQSEHFTGPFNRQIAPPTKNGHAPPPIESRKSYQSVNPYYVLDLLFVFHKSKNFTSDYEIRMPPTVPVNHYSDPEGQHNRIRILWCYPMLMYPERRLALSTLISSK
ncbi:hypothetical protein Fmac_028177 [Flemingia macrophylla]|uniref:Uncharacterized protein n=1 Tax=Flemingia macrophylla TaxID=520843 RepID=A0ABD1L765_9FABA